MERTQVLIKPVITEKAAQMRERARQVVFIVHAGANKIEIKQAVEAAFNVKVLGVNVSNRRPEKRVRNRRVVHIAGSRKAYVTLAAGEKIDLFEGV
jgi:large subunit ribosomal protein L23